MAARLKENVEREFKTRRRRSRHRPSDLCRSSVLLLFKDAVLFQLGVNTKVFDLKQRCKVFCLKACRVDVMPGRYQSTTTRFSKNKFSSLIVQWPAAAVIGYRWRVVQILNACGIKAISTRLTERADWRFFKPHLVFSKPLLVSGDRF